jgi:hypothetical protein
MVYPFNKRCFWQFKYIKGREDNEHREGRATQDHFKKKAEHQIL